MSWMITIAPGTPGEESAVDELLARVSLPPIAVVTGARAFLVAMEEGRLVGCGALETVGAIALVRALAVTPAARGRGLGRQLVRQLVDRAIRKGCTSVYLLPFDASEFFFRMGFRPVSWEDVPSEVRDFDHFRTTGCAATTMMSFPLAGSSGDA